MPHELADELVDVFTRDDALDLAAQPVKMLRELQFHAGPAVAAGLRDVVVRYPGRSPIGPVDLTVAAGEILAVVGASGAGKSTLLRVLARVEAPSEGTVGGGGGPGRTGFVFQNPNAKGSCGCGESFTV